MRVLVTGAAGFVGSRLSRRLLDRGDEVVGLDNLNDYYSVELKERHLADLTPDPRFQFVREDLRNAAGISRVFEEHQPDGVAHLGGMAAVRYSIQHPLLYGEVNVQGSMNVLDAARLHGRPRLVMASTSSVYGSDTPVPFPVTAAAAHPLAPYPASKRAMELFAHSYHQLWGLPITIFRFFNVYGPHGRPDMMPWQWTQAIHHGKPITLFNGGHMHRDWTFIDDIVDGLVAALDRGLDWEILNLGRGCPVENVDFVRVLEKLLGKDAVIVEAPAPPSEPPITFADVSRTTELLGYEPKVSVDEGLARFVDWLRSETLL